MTSIRPFAIALVEPPPQLPDLTVNMANANFTCSTTTQDTVCTRMGRWSLANSGVENGSATFRVTTTKREKPG